MSSLGLIHPRAFEGLPRLARVHILSHSLQRAPELNTVGKRLEFFTLSNFEGEYDDIHLEPLKALTSLVMEKAGLTVVPKDIRHVSTTLKALRLTENKITTLNNMYDMEFIRLRGLFLDNNNISYLNPVPLQLPNLETFSIKHNKLTMLPELRHCAWGMANQAITFFVLDDNPWHCNGSMMRLQESLCDSWGEIRYRRMMLTIVLENTYCYSPTEVQGRMVLDVEKIGSDEIDKCGEWLMYYHFTF